MTFVSGQNEVLFCKTDITTVMQEQIDRAIAELRGIDADRLLNTPIDDLVDYISRNYRIDVPTLDRASAVLDQPQETHVSVNDYGRQIQVPATLVTLTVPFSGDMGMFFVRPNTFDAGPPRAAIKSDALVVRLIVRHSEQDQVKDRLSGILGDIERYLGWQQPSIEQFNKSLPAQARHRERILRDRKMLSGLGFAVRPRSNAPVTYAAPQVRRKIESQLPPAASTPFKPEPVLEEVHYNHILDVISNMTFVMERSPTAFAEMREEDIRQHYLVQLNGHFEGQATGETFNHVGKTDILIRVEGRNIFIAECKFWRGEKQFVETVDQILSYLSWRDTKAAIILFNRNKGFSQVLERIKAVMAGHPHKKRGPKEESETRFRYIFGNPSDHSREIILTVLAFDGPSSAPDPS